MTVTKGEAQARVVSVNAAAEAQRTTLEGNAESGITFTKGEAKAKALALRADACRQFNEAAIIQTVLSMLPEIVRAAAEPLSNIDTLAVLSNDGASDLAEAWGVRPAGETAAAEAPREAATPSNPPATDTTAAADAAMTAADRAIRATSESTPAPGQRTDTAAGPARPATRPASADITAETTVDEAATKLASDLRAIPGIERFAGVRLAGLETRGPRPLRRMWQFSHEQLDQRYGQLTIGELIDRYGGGSQPPA